MENQLLAAVALFVLGCISICIIIGYISLWYNYPVIAIIATVAIMGAVACSLYRKKKK